MSPLAITEVNFVHCNIANNYYEHDSRVFHTFVPSKPFAQFLDFSPKIFIFFESLIQSFYILKYGLPIQSLSR